MSHIVSLRSASLRALRSSSTASSAVLAATKCTTYSQRSIGQQQQYSYSTLPPTSTGILARERQRVCRSFIHSFKSDMSILWRISFPIFTKRRRKVSASEIIFHSFLDTLGANTCY